MEYYLYIGFPTLKCIHTVAFCQLVCVCVCVYVSAFLLSTSLMMDGLWSTRVDVGYY